MNDNDDTIPMNRDEIRAALAVADARQAAENAYRRSKRTVRALAALRKAAKP